MKKDTFGLADRLEKWEIIKNEEGDDEHFWLDDYDPYKGVKWYKKFYEKSKLQIRWKYESLTSYFRHIKNKVSRLTNGKGYTEDDICFLNESIYNWLYPRIKDFYKRALDVEFIPGVYFKRSKYGKETEEERKKAVEYWHHDLNEALFALEFFAIVENKLFEDITTRNFWLKYYNETPWYEKGNEINEKNINKNYYYYMLEKDPKLSRWVSCGEELSEEECTEKKYELRRINSYYYNYDLYYDARKRALKGMKILGKIIPHLWTFTDNAIEEFDKLEKEEEIKALDAC